MQTGDTRLIKNINDQLVLNLIREHGLISGSQLAAITGMRPSTISNTLKTLSEKDLIINCGKGVSTTRGGKRPWLWSLNKDAACMVGLDVDIGEIAAVVIDLCGTVIKRKVLASEDIRSLDDLVFQLRESWRTIIREAGVSRKNIAGLGLAFAGVVNREHGIVHLTDVILRRNIHLLEELEHFFTIPLHIENNANAAAIGEKWLGIGQSSRDFLTVLINVEKDVGGMGLGLVIRDEVYHGADYCAGELNIPLPNVSAILEDISGTVDLDGFLQQCGKPLDEIDIACLIRAAHAQDPVAATFFSRLGETVGRSIARPVAMINPEKIILAGEIADVGELIATPVANAIKPLILHQVAKTLKVETSRHGRYSVALGAASLVLQEFFRVPLIATGRRA